MSKTHTFSRREFFKTACISAAVPLFGNGAHLFSWTDNQEIALVPDLKKLNELLNRKEPNIWLFTGDSITQGAKHTHGGRSYPEVFSERIRWELHRVRDFVINTGISGNTTRNILDDFEWRISQFKPAAVSLMIGTNDCAKHDIDLSVFEQNLVTLQSKIRQLGAIPILHTPNPIIEEKAPERARLSEYIPVIQDVAEKNKIVLVDNWAYWQSQPQEKMRREWLNDPLHPNDAGHLEIAQLMFKELNIFDPKDPTCGGEYYEGEH